MKTPFIAILGRVNVGKSALFNAILGKNQALVADFPGSTRDRNIQWTYDYSHPFYVCDTGGLIFQASSGQEAAHTYFNKSADKSADKSLQEQIHKQVDFALEEADAVFFVVDRKTGLTGEDREAFQQVRKSLGKVWLVVNKVDDPNHQPDTYDFFSLGAAKVFSVSALHKIGIEDLVEDCLTDLLGKPEVAKKDPYLETVKPEKETEEKASTEKIEPTPIKIAVIGKPNAGKSTLINLWAGKERLVVSPVAGTTRDPIDIELKFHKQDLVLIDTAGMKRKSKWQGFDHFVGITTFRTIERADICLLLFDVTQGFTDQDIKLASFVLTQGKCLLLAGNKWDLYPDKDSLSAENFKEEFYAEHPYLDFCELELFSALKKQRSHKLLERLVETVKLSRKRISSAELNQVLTYVREKLQLGVEQTQKLAVKYGTQIKTAPPLFVFHVNDPAKVPKSFERFMIKQIRRFFPYPGTPIKIFWRKK